MIRKKIACDHTWKFMLDPQDQGLEKQYYEKKLEDTKDVLVPHTFNVGNGTDTYRGIAWYQYSFQVEEDWKDGVLRLQFNGVYRDARFWVNGVEVGNHYNAGFTTFMLDISKTVKWGEENLLTVRVDNRYSPYALPWHDQFDWADDGGIFRPVYLLVTDQFSVKAALIEAIPQIEKIGKRVQQASALILYHVEMTEKNEHYILEYELLDEGKLLQKGICKEAGSCEERNTREELVLGENTIDGEIFVQNVQLWHFDAPKLYTFRLYTKIDDKIRDIYETSIGFRKFEICGCNFVFNGEKVELVGTEWMPGSDPRIGNAERPEDIARYLQILKESNCVYTRVHWQQDESFYQWCDMHGILVQEEVPLWGQPNEPAHNVLEVVKAQFKEMMESHYNHPSIISWGIGNELNGQSEITKTYVKEIVKWVHTYNPYRPVSFVSNTMWGTKDDANCYSDIMMCNEYIGTWHVGFDNNQAVKEYREANPDKPMVISEFGLCESVFPWGNKASEKIFLDKIGIYRRNGINGCIYFCLNDYRTQMGEDGKGALRYRIFGAVDLYGKKKTSYEAVKRECAPVEMLYFGQEKDMLHIKLEVREHLPAYEINGYYLMVSAIGEAPVYEKIPRAKPGEILELNIQWNSEKVPLLKIYRPTGDEILSAQL